MAAVYLPLSRPVLVTIALLTAIPTWNEYLLTRVSLNDPRTFTLPIALQNLQSSAVLHYNVLMAGALIVVVPVIVLSASPATAGTVRLDGNETRPGYYEQGSPVTATARPATGYRLVDWTVGGTVVSTDPNYTFTVVGDQPLTADFAPLGG